MLRLLSLIASLLCAVYSQEFKGQVTKVYANIDMVHTQLLLGNSPPAQFYPMGYYNPNIRPNGTITATPTTPVGLYGRQEFLIEPGKQLHFRFEASYHSNGLVEGPSDDIIFGYASLGTFLRNVGMFWILTDTVEYIMAQTIYRLYVIPIGRRTPDEMATYTVVLDQPSVKVRFYKNNISYLTIPGSCGIDPRFAYGQVGKGAETVEICTPLLTEADFEGTARIDINLSTLLRDPSGPLYPSDICMGCIFDQCRENLSHAFGCQCQRPLPANNVTDSTTYFLQLDSIQVYEMQKTERCDDNESSSSTMRPWWQQPCLKEVDGSGNE